jgi:hypothetical protein
MPTLTKKSLSSTSSNRPAVAIARAADPESRRLLAAAWLIGGVSSLILSYFEYFAFTADLEISHTSLVGYPSYLIALVITTTLAILYARRRHGKTWTWPTILLTTWTIISITLVIVVKNSAS